MITRRVVVVLFLALASTLGSAGRAGACYLCDAFLHCGTSAAGGRYCIEKPGVCALLVQCLFSGSRVPEITADEDLTAWSLFDATGPSTPSVRNEAGPIAIGNEARGLAGAPGRAGALADAGLVYGDGYAISFVDAMGDGFALKRSVEGGRVRVEVREVMHDMPGRVLAAESLGPRDQLSIPVRVEGRDRVLLLHAAKAHGANGGPYVARLRRALHDAGLELPPRAEPLLQAHAQ